MRRRRLLASVAAAAGGLAGCVGSGDPGSGDPGDDTPDTTPTPTRTEVPTETPTPTPTQTPSEPDEQPTVRGTTIETLDAECASGDGELIDAVFGPESVAVEGVATAPDPCHAATLESATAEDGELRVAVGLESGEGACADCVGAVTYAARVELDGADGVDAVTVTHAESGETYTVGRDRAGSGTASPTGEPEETPLGEPEADPDLAITAENAHDEPHEVAVTVRRESGETVHRSVRRLEPGEEATLYNLREADPDGIETFEVVAETGGASETIRVRTSTCYGDVVVSVTEDGTLYPYHAIC